MHNYNRTCAACRQDMNCNQYGLGDCPSCGFDNNPYKADEGKRAQKWREDMTENSSYVDNFIQEIKRGNWDCNLTDLQNAITTRNLLRRENVIALVYDVYGPNATISVPR